MARSFLAQVWASGFSGFKVTCPALALESDPRRVSGLPQIVQKHTKLFGVPDELELRLLGIETLEYLWRSSHQIVNASAKIQFNEARLVIGERCFRRIMLMALTFLRLSPLSSFFPKDGHWDLPSSAAIARCVIETYLRMFYFGVEQVDKPEGDFRALLSQYHAQFQNLEIHTDSRMPTALLAPLQAMCDKARSALKQNEHFRNLPEKWKKTLIENPSRINLPEISKRAGISPGYHHSSYEFCSSFVHGSLYAMDLTESVNLQNGQGKEFFQQLTDTLCGYVSLAIRDFKQLFPELPSLEPRLVFLGQAWSIIVRWENIPGFDDMRHLAHQLENPNEPAS